MVESEYTLEDRTYSLMDKCWRWLPFDFTFLWVFEKLPRRRITLKDSLAYQNFLIDWGSHVITQLSTGLKINLKSMH